MQALCTETTLIATGAQTEDYDETDAVEIPFDLDIEVCIAYTEGHIGVGY